MAEEKKIIVDDDWKQQAQNEKAHADDEIKQEEAEKQRSPLPKGDFTSLVSMLSTQAFMALGLIGHPDQKEKPKLDLDIAKYTIDILADLEEKTKGNLSDDEKTMLEASLSQLRMAFVKLSGE